MVAERQGVLRFYHVGQPHPLVSLQAGPTPLSDADWSWANPRLVGARAGAAWLVWDRELSSGPTVQSALPSGAHGIFRFVSPVLRDDIDSSESMSLPVMVTPASPRPCISQLGTNRAPDVRHGLQRPGGDLHRARGAERCRVSGPR